jgi:hypothetical protein
VPNSTASPAHQREQDFACLVHPGVRRFNPYSPDSLPHPQESPLMSTEQAVSIFIGVTTFLVGGLDWLIRK